MLMNEVIVSLLELSVLYSSREEILNTHTKNPYPTYSSLSLAFFFLIWSSLFLKIFIYLAICLFIYFDFCCYEGQNQSWLIQRDRLGSYWGGRTCTWQLTIACVFVFVFKLFTLHLCHAHCLLSCLNPLMWGEQEVNKMHFCLEIEENLIPEHIIIEKWQGRGVNTRKSQMARGY